MPEDSMAGDELASPPQVGDSASAVTVPMGLLPGCKVGDTYTVKSVDGDNVTLEAMPSDNEDTEQWGNDAIAHVKEKGMTDA
jgi:hypothetical protein